MSNFPKRKKKNCRRNCFIAAVFCVFTVIAAIQYGCGIEAFASSKENQKVVKVGWYEADGLQYEDSKGNRTGYAYDYYQEISKYTGITYAYVEGTWKQCMEWLENGEIDVLANVDFSDERAQKLDYSVVDMGSTETTLVALSRSEEFEINTLNGVDGKKIGVISGSARPQDLMKLLDDNQLSCTLVYYDGYEEVFEALEAGEVDLAVSNTIHKIPENTHIIYQFGSKHTYFAVKKGNTDLLEQINYALNCIEKYEPDFQNQLKELYYGENRRIFLDLTEEEQAFLNEHSSLEFVSPPQRGYLSYESDGAEMGIQITLVEQIAEILGIEATYKEVDEYSEIAGMAESGDFDVMCGFYYDFSWAEQKNLSISSPYLTLKYYEITNSTKELPEESRLKVAAVRQLRFTDEYVLQRYEEEQITWYDSEEECIQAVNEGKQDITYCDNYTAEYVISDYQINKVTANLIPYENKICFACSKDNRILSSILSKAIAAVGEDQIEQIVTENTTQVTTDMTLEDWIYVNPMEAQVIGILGLTLIGGFVFSVIMVIITKRKNKKIQKADEAKTMFLSMMSHEMRTPLTAIIGLNEINQQKAENKVVLEGTKKIGVAASHLTELINNVLDITRISDGKTTLVPEAFVLQDMLEEIKVIYTETALSRNMDFQIVQELDRTVCVYADKLRLKQILINLISNALKYTPDGGKIRFYINEYQPATEECCYIHFEVTDTGSGIADHDKAHIFDMFERAKVWQNSHVSGSGLGLALSQQLAGLMGSEIRFESREGEGSRFWLDLALKPTEELLKKESLKSRPDLNGKKYLVAEDNEINAYIIKTILTDAGALVELAENGKQAYEAFAASELYEYAGVFMDLHMPVMNGYEATAAIRGLDREDAGKVLIIAVSANAFEEDVQKALDSGMNAHCRKPIDAGELFGCLK